MPAMAAIALALSRGGTSEQVGRFQPDKGAETMRASTAYFVGAGTVIAAIVAGVGGGLLIGDVISPKSPKQGIEMTRLDGRVSPEPLAAVREPPQPQPSLTAPH